MNRKDMGFAKYAMWTNNAMSKVSGAVQSVKNTLSGNGNGISNMFSQIKADLSKSSVGGKSGYDTINKNNNIKREKIEVSQNNQSNQQNSQHNTTNKYNTNNKSEYQNEYNYNMQTIRQEVAKDTSESESIKSKVKSGENKVAQSMTSKQSSTPGDGEPTKGGIDRQPVDSQWNKRTY
jgi:hypothetical protein